MGLAGLRSRVVRFLSAFLFTSTPTLAASPPPSESPQVIRIATASKAGTFYPIGSLIAEGITGAPGCVEASECGVPGLVAVAQVSNGSVANVEAVSAGSIQAALAQADVIYWAYNAEGRFHGHKPRTNLRAVANLFPGSLHIVTSAESDIARPDDLRGKRVALDEPGSGTLATAELVLNSVGIEKRDISPLYIKHNHAAPMLAERELDAFFFVAGYPTASILDLARTTQISLVPLAVQTINHISAARPYLTRGIIPSGAYPNVEEDVPTLDIGTQLLVNSDADPELVYRITKALWSERTRKLLDEGHPKGKQVRLENALKGIAIPLHDGAVRFYGEAGMLKK